MAGVFASLWGRLTSRGDAISARGGAPDDDVLADLEAGRAIPDDLVDAFLDGEVPPERQGALFSALRSDVDAHIRLDQTEQAIDALRSADTPPDFTARILSEVHRRRGLLDRSGLRRVWATRWALAACVVIAAAGVFIVRRSAPDDLALVPAPAPIRDLAKTIPQESQVAVLFARSALEPVRQINSELVQAPSRASDDEHIVVPVAGRIRSACPGPALALWTPPVLDTRLFVSTWLDGVADSAAFARASMPSRQRAVATVPVAWSPPGAGTITPDGPVISVRTLLLEPGRPVAEEEGARLFTPARR